MRIPTPSRAFFLILTLFVIEAPLAVRGAPPAAFPAPAQRFDRGLLWRVDVPGAAPSYLFGSLHSDDDRLRSLPPPVRRAFSRSRVVAMEALNDEPSVRRFRAAMVSRDAPLPELLGEQAFL